MRQEIPYSLFGPLSVIGSTSSHTAKIETPQTGTR